MKLTNKSNKQFVKDFSSSHYYQLTEDGQVVPQYEATLREARKLNLFPSPTTIEKDIRANPTLGRWIKNEVAKAFVANPRFPGEDDEAYAARCLAVADSIAKDAAARGTAIHDAIEHGFTSDPIIRPFLEAYLPWQDRNVKSIFGHEVMLCDKRIGVAGKTDMVVEHNEYGPTIIDIKTMKFRDGKPSFWDSYPRQVSFYAEAWRQKHGELPRIMIVGIDSQNPSPPQEKLYTMEEQAMAHKSFLCQSWLWFSSKPMGGFWPVGRWEPSFYFNQ